MYLLAYDDGSFGQQAELDDDLLEALNNGEVTIITLKDGKFCTVAVDKKEGGGLEIAAHNTI